MEQLIKKIEKEYDFHVQKLSVIKDKPLSSFVAKIKTINGKEYALKTLYLDKNRQEFIVETEKLLSKNGVKIAKPVLTKNKYLYFMYGDYPYVLYKWIKGNAHPLNNAKDLISLTKTIAQFHSSSKGLKFPRGITIYSHMDWEKEYNIRLNNLYTWFNNHQSSNDENINYILKWIPYFIKNGQKALNLLKQSKYHSIVSAPLNKQTLVHGDLHRNNVIVNDNNNILFDFEDVRYDIPSKDLLRIYSMYIKKKKFTAETFDKVIREYKKFNSISSDIEKLIYIDFYFPNIIEHMIRKKRYERYDFQKLKHYIKQEKKKAELMKKMIN